MLAHMVARISLETDFIITCIGVLFVIGLLKVGEVTSFRKSDLVAPQLAPNTMWPAVPMQ